MMNEVLYDKQGNLLQKYLVTETKNGVEVPKITREKRTYYDSDSDAMKSIYTQRFTPDEEKIKNELSTISKTLFGKYSITNENIQSIMQDLGIEGNAVAGPNNNVNLYNQIEQSVADKTIEGLSTKIFDFVNPQTQKLKDISVGEYREKVGDKGGSGKTKRDPKRYFESIRKNPLGQIKEAIGKGQTYANDEKPTVRNNIVKIPDKLLERFNFDLPEKEKGDLEYIEYDLNTQPGLVGFVNFIAKNSGYGFKGEFLQELGDIARQSAQEQDLYDSDNIEVINQDFSK